MFCKSHLQRKIKSRGTCLRYKIKLQSKCISVNFITILETLCLYCTCRNLLDTLAEVGEKSFESNFTDLFVKYIYPNVHIIRIPSTESYKEEASPPKPYRGGATIGSGRGTAGTRRDIRLVCCTTRCKSSTRKGLQMNSSIPTPLHLSCNTCAVKPDQRYNPSTAVLP